MILGGAVIGNGDLHTRGLRSETELSKPQLITTGDRGGFLGSDHDAKGGCFFSLSLRVTLLLIVAAIKMAVFMKTIYFGIRSV